MPLLWREYVATATFRNPCLSFAMTTQANARAGPRVEPRAACAADRSLSEGAAVWLERHLLAPAGLLHSRHSLRIASGGHSQQACSRALVAHVCRSLSCIRSVRYSDYGSVASQHSDAGRPSRCGARPTGTWAYAGDRRWRHACGGWRGADLFSRSGLQGEGIHKSFWIHRLACRTAAGRDLSRDGAVARWRWDCV